MTVDVVRQIIEQVDEAIARMLNDSRIDINADWKVFSLLLGQNDICFSCDVSVRLWVASGGDGIGKKKNNGWMDGWMVG